MKLALAVQIALLAIIYAGIARLGLDLHAVGGFATLVWPPTGIALVALLRVDARLWPGIWLGATAVNAWVGAPLLVACGIGAGNTLEAVLGAGALRRVSGFDPSLERPRHVLALVLLGALAAPLVSASIGVASLSAGGELAADELAITWRTWWLGDVLGALVIAPLLLTFSRPTQIQVRRPLEAALLAAAVIAASLLVFGLEVIAEPAFQQPYLLFPVLMWAALRFGPRGAAASTFAVAAIAVAMTARGLGPFARGDLTTDLMTLQVFVAFMATTFLVLAALVVSAQAARLQAERASLAKTNFLNLVSHELRTPLTSLLLQAERLRIASGSMDAEQQRLVARMLVQAHRLTDLIDGLLEHVLIESGRLTLRVEAFVPEELARTCIDELRAQAEAKALGLELDVGAPAPFAGDPRLVRLILINLLSNAVKFTETGRVATTVARRDGRLTLAVTDTGPGIPSSEQARIFQPFEQLDPLSRKHFAGIGLGLSLVAEMVRFLGGTVVVESQPGKGSTFTVELPAASTDGQDSDAGRG